MSSFKKADGIIDSIQKQATGLRTLDGSAIEDFLSIAGYVDPQGGGGGGGDSDFEVVTVTFTNSAEDTQYYATGFASINDEDALDVYNIQVVDSVEVKVVLYKGKAYMTPDDWDYETDPVVTGDITYDSEDTIFIISGAGTITVAGTGGMS